MPVRTSRAWRDRPIRRPLLVGRLIVLLALPAMSALSGLPSPSAQAGPAPAGDAALCLRAARQAATEEGIPEDVMIALTLTETGRRRDGVTQPWPWAVNDGGDGYWFDSRDAALSFAFGRFKAGARSFDVGCFQLNFRWHSDAFASLADMFDPLQNARYAARFLKSHHAETGDWQLAAGRYHSRTEVHAARYRDIFAGHRSAAADLGPVPMPVPAAASLAGLAALSAGTAPAGPGSLVSLSDRAAPLLVKARGIFE